MKQDLILLKKLWYNRNPAHIRDAQGNDMFWFTIHTIFQEYLQLLDNIPEDTLNQKKSDVESLLIDLWKSIGMDIPDNYKDIIEFVFKDICETADPDHWDEDNIAIAFRRWVESKTYTH